MFEVRVLIESPQLAEAINNLAAAIGSAKQIQQTAPSQIPAPVLKPAPTDVTVTVNPPFAQPGVPVNPPFAQPGVPVAPAQPVPSAPAPGNVPVPNVPLAEPPKYTVDQIMAAGATLMDAGKVNELINLLHSFGVQAVMDLKPEQLGAFATAMRELGAKI